MSTITIDRAVVEQALEALLNSRPLATEDDCVDKVREHNKAITALRAALAQQAEPVAGKVVAWGVFASIDGEWQLQHPVFAGDEQGKVNAEFERASYSGPQPLEVRPLGVVTATAQQAEPVDTDCHAQGICQRSGYGIRQQAEPVAHNIADEMLKMLEEVSLTDPVFADRVICKIDAVLPAFRAALAQQAEPLNLSDPAIRKRLAAQWGYVPAAAQAEPVARECSDPMCACRGGPCAECEEGEREKEIEDLRSSLYFYQRRCEALQSWQSKMRDPERTIVCDILANGKTLDSAVAGDRYTAPPQRKPLTEEEIEACRQQGYAHAGFSAPFDFDKAARAVERAHGIKE